jgi:hypothetical protein
VSAPLALGVSCGRAPLLGHNLVRLVYLDEAGTDFRAPFLCVAGVIVHGDRQWPEIDRKISALIEKYVEEIELRPRFFFHAKDIFHGNGYFDRHKTRWKEPIDRFKVLLDLAGVIGDLKLPVVSGQYEKQGFGYELVSKEERPQIFHNMMHMSAALDCLISADKWLEEYYPDEIATVVHEDGNKSKKHIKLIVRLLRDRDLLVSEGYGNLIEAMPGSIPLKRIIDTVHFAEKPDARSLQLADLCAFTFSRAARKQLLPDGLFDIIMASDFRFMEFIRRKYEAS